MDQSAKDKTIDRSIPMVIFLTAVILAGLVTSGRDQKAADQIRNLLSGNAHPAAATSK
jgi:hypothetical protein